MIKYIFSILSTKNPNMIILKILLLFTIIYLLQIFLRKKETYREQEAFTQNDKFLLKNDEDIYDEFYCQIHDNIHKPEYRVGYELIQIIKMTEPSALNSVFLDVGSGTGKIIHELQEAGYLAYGIDKSQAMVKQAEKKYPESEFKCGNVLQPMEFEKNTFTHVLCTYFTVYQIEDKKTFFYNVYNWLKPNGYFIIHLVNPDKYDTLSPIGKSKLVVNPHRFESSRITDTIVNFPDFQYTSKYDFNKMKSNVVTIKETFKDNKTSKIRQNVQTLHMEKLDYLVHMISNIGFIVKGKFDMKKCIDDDNQFMYIFEKI